jgi:DNA-binding SARP family transcriptional activator
VGPTTEFRILGPLEVLAGARPVRLPRGKAGALLARLLLDANRTVSVDALIDALWDEDVPASAVKMVHVYVSQLRKALPDGVLRTQAPGYVLDAAPEALDLDRFTRLRGEGRAALAAGDAAGASALLRSGLALWRGAALAEFSEPFAAAQAGHLEEMRVACVEDRIDADLALGHHADVVGQLRIRVAENTLRERPRRQLMLALYRSGRHAEALDVYRDFRQTLRDDLGIEPSAALSELHDRMLTQDASLDLAPGDGPPAAEPAGGTRPDAVVGRADELQRLARAFEDAADARGTTALVVGPAGIGKTLLTSTLAQHARARGATVLSGRCIDLVGAGLPYLPLVEALRPLCTSPLLDTVRDELVELPRLHPDLAGGAPLAPHGDGTDTRMRLFGEVLAVLEHLSRGAPVVLLLEDLHWADGSTLDLIAYLAQAIHGRRILLVATYRSDAKHEVDRVSAGLQRTRTAVTVQLGPLERDALEAVIADERLPSELSDVVCARSDGNPFFAMELAAAAARDEQHLPSALRDLLLADIDRLDAETRAVLRVVAAAGRDVPYRLLAAVMTLPEPSIHDALRQAVEHHVLVPDQSTGSFRFRHALFAEAVYGTLLPGEREEVHARLAAALEDDGSLAASRAIAGELAQHWVAARQPVQALAASLQAARDAQALSGLGEALRHLEQVLELWDLVPNAEDLAGIALPAMLDWAEQLATMTARDDGDLADVITEARELYPLAVALESIAVRQSPPLDASALDFMRDANARMRTALDDPSAASAADDDFHARLTADCGDTRLLAALRTVKQALLRYEQVYMLDASRIERSAAQHDAIIAALERGDHVQAAQRVRENLTGGLPDLAAVLAA